jgi:transcription elongation factor GreA
MGSLSGAEVANYAERLSRSDTGYRKKLELIRGFLSYARKKGWSKANLAGHIKVRKGKEPVSARREPTKTTFLTKEGYAGAEAELASLRSKRLEVIEEIRRAAADKDFRENAPLQAAREQRSHLEGRILELEEALKTAVVVEERQRAEFKANVGDSIVLKDMNSGTELRYMLVGPREIDPTKGRISVVSPIGRAIIGKAEGDIVEINTPSRRLKYQVKSIGH